MSERVKLFFRYLSGGGLYPCNIFTSLVFECPEQVLSAIQSLEADVCLKDRNLCNCFAATDVDCDCLPMPLLNHLVYIVSSFTKPFRLVQQIIEALVNRGCDVNRVDADIGTALHSVICCIDNDFKLNVSKRESEMSFQCLEYLLSLNLCDLNLNVGYEETSKARGTPLFLAIEKELAPVVTRLLPLSGSVNQLAINRRLVPEVMSESSIQIFDLLFEAGLRLDSSVNTRHRHITDPRSGLILYRDWIADKKSRPMKLKSLVRIAIRRALNDKISDNSIFNVIPLPKTLEFYLKFKENFQN